MSSVGLLAAAPVAATQGPEPDVAPSSLTRVLPSAQFEERLWNAALHADRNGPQWLCFPALWDRLSEGSLQVYAQVATPERLHLIAKTVQGPVAVANARESALVIRVLCGDARKAVASSVPPSTAAGWCSRFLGRLALASRRVPLPVVLAAQCRAGVVRLPDARSGSFERNGCRYVSMSVPRPITGHLRCLTPAEREIARWLIEGYTRTEIAALRGTSPNTVAVQVHSVFAALQVTGRYALIRSAVESKCFVDLQIAADLAIP